LISLLLCGELLNTDSFMRSARSARARVRAQRDGRIRHQPPRVTAFTVGFAEK
jgi:hypothetical protein